MARCEVYGNDYDKSSTITTNGKAPVFDSFERAIHAIVPICEHCQCRVIGHGVEAGGVIYCCANPHGCPVLSPARIEPKYALWALSQFVSNLRVTW
jgi:hypothetical protein